MFIKKENFESPLFPHFHFHIYDAADVGSKTSRPLKPEGSQISITKTYMHDIHEKVHLKTKLLYFMSLILRNHTQNVRERKVYLLSASTIRCV